MRYLLYNRPTDMRKSFHTLSGIITDAMGQDPCSGNVYIFINRARDRIKLLHWEPGGMVLYSKLLEAGTLGKPDSVNDNEVCANIEWRELVMIVEGIMEASDSRRTRLENLQKLRKQCRFLTLFAFVCHWILVYLHCETMRYRCLRKNRKKPYWKRLISSARIKRRLSAGLLRWSSRCTGSGKKSSDG